MFISKKTLNKLENRIIELEDKVETMSKALGYEEYSDISTPQPGIFHSVWIERRLIQKVTKWEKLLDYLGLEWQEAVKESKFVKKKKEYAQETKGKTRIT